jgi:hypothetical protein
MILELTEHVMSATVSVRGTLEMKRGWLPVLLGCMVIGGAAAQSPRATLYEEAKCASPETALDGIVFKSFAKAGVRPMYCTDAVFLRRAYLDVIGTLPTADEARAFLSDTSLNKRRALVERLLERDEFADYWAMKWSDLLRVKAEFPGNRRPNAAQAYHRCCAPRSATTSLTTGWPASCSPRTAAISASAPSISTAPSRPLPKASPPPWRSPSWCRAENCPPTRWPRSVFFHGQL